MAKTPDDPRHPRPGDPLPENNPGGSDETIDLGTREGFPLDDPGSISVIDRALLADRQGAPPTGRMSPSDADSLAGAVPPGEGSAIDLGRNVPSGPGSDVVGAPQDSGIDLAEAVPIDERPPVWIMGEGSAIDLGPEVVAPDGSKPPSSLGADESAIDLDESALVEEVDSSSGYSPRSAVDLAGKGARPGSDSGIDLQAEPISDKPLVAKSDSGIDLVEENIVLQDASGSPSGSGRDLIAEKLESGVDLLDKKTRPPEDVAELDALAQTDLSSSVDLGSMADMPAFTDSGKEIPSESEARIEQAAKDAAKRREPITSAEEIDLAPPPAKPRKDSKKVAALASVPDADEPAVKGKKAKQDPDAEPEADEGKKKPKKAATTARGTAWFGGTVLGAALGTAACIGLWTFGVEPPEDLRKAAGTTTNRPGGPGGPPQAGMMGGPPQAGMMGGPQGGMMGQQGGPQMGQQIGMPPQAGGMIGLGGLVARGDIDVITPAHLDRVDPTKPDELVHRADYHWLKYLQEERGKDPEAKLSADAEPVKKALADLKAAIDLKSGDALFLRGQIYQELGLLKEAQSDFEAGVKLTGDDADARARFDNALRALRLAASRAHLLPPGMPPQALALLLVTLQDDDKKDDKKKDDKPKAPPEAGFAFFDALELVGQNKFAEAQKKLAEARQRHNQRRFLMPRRPQNPQSDPREDIFLKAVDQLAAYWALLAKLNDPKYLQLGAKDRVPAVDKLLASARAAAVQEITDKLAKGQTVKTVDDLVKVVAAERTAAADALKDATTKLDDKTKEASGLAEKLKDEKKATEKARDDEKATRALLVKSEAREKALKSDGEAAVAALKQVGEAAGVKFVDVKTTTTALVKDIKDAKAQAAMKDPKGEIRRLEGELTTAKAELGRRWPPAEMLSAWLDALPGDGGNALGARALKDVARVEALAGATAEQKAQAQLIRGLVLKNQEKYAEAEAALAKAKAALSGDWQKRATAALDQVRNPSGDAVAQAAELQARGKTKEALAALERAMKRLTDKKGPLYAQRANIALEGALSKGKLDDKDSLVASAEKDAKLAVADGVARGHYVLGQIAEGLGKLADAEKSYRAAMAGEKDDAAVARATAALARVLRKKGETGAVSRARPDLRTTSVLVALMLQPPGKGDDDAEVLADKVLAMGDKAPFDARAQALAIKGLHTRALTTYLAGLRDDKQLGATHAAALLDLLAGHPSLKRPESRTTADPLKADGHYAAGLNLFFARKHAEAEKEFLSAVENDKTDARFHYFLGLARLAQGKREAQEDFDTAAELERLGKPNRAAVAAALERVQGPLRRALNDARTRPVKDGK